MVDLDEIVCRHAITGRDDYRLAVIDRADLLCAYENECNEDECPCCRYTACDCKNRCPSNCHCYRDATFAINIVRCTNVTSIVDSKGIVRPIRPADIPMQATRVYLDGANLTTLNRGDFLSRKHLRQLYLNGSNIEHIDANVFNGLSSLEVLDLSANRLRQWIGVEIQSLPKLRMLFMNDNRLERIDDNAFVGLHSLQSITLHNNRLYDIPIAVQTLANSIYSLTLGDNPYRCDCDRQRFRMQSWLADVEHRQKVCRHTYICCSKLSLSSQLEAKPKSKVKPKLKPKHQVQSLHLSDIRCRSNILCRKYDGRIS